MKKLIRKIVSAALASALVLGLTACGAKANEETKVSVSNEEVAAAEKVETSETSTEEATVDAEKKIIVGATPVPHADILENAVKAVLAEAGWELEVVVFQDYVLPNTSLEAGELDANYFQTLGYMNGQNADAGLHLAAVAGVHIEPMGVYSQKYASSLYKRS